MVVDPLALSVDTVALRRFATEDRRRLAGVELTAHRLQQTQARSVAALGYRPLPDTGPGLSGFVERQRYTIGCVDGIADDLGTPCPASPDVTWPRNLVDPTNPVTWLFNPAARSVFSRTVAAGLDPVDDAIVDSLPALDAASEAAAWGVFGPFTPMAHETMNRHVTPRVVGGLWWGLDLVTPDGESTGDPEGTFDSRATGTRLLDVAGTPAQQGRIAAISALEDTANGETILQDEFQIIRHDEATYTVVLAGVTDLTSPNAGLNPHNYTGRDLDYSAAWSAASASVSDNVYANMVFTALRRNEVPPDTNLLIVGHSQGADTALDLAADPYFNGRIFNVTHVVAAAYHSAPQLPSVQPGTAVLAIQNNKDIPVIVEMFGHRNSNPLAEFQPPSGTIVREFDGGWSGFGHHQDHYINYLEAPGDHDDQVTQFFESVFDTGYSTQGDAHAIDISLITN